VEWLGLFFFKKINVGVRASLRAPRLIPRALKLKLPVAIILATTGLGPVRLDFLSYRLMSEFS